MTNLTLWVLLMPLFGFIILGLLGRVMSRRGILAVALGASGLAFVFTTISMVAESGSKSNPKLILSGAIPTVTPEFTQV